MIFNETIDRRNTNSLKWDNPDLKYNPENLIPLWVADMDFRAPESVLKTLAERIEHGVVGYTFPPDGYYRSIVNWMGKRHQWNIKKEWILPVPGVVPSINIAIQAFTKEGEGVLIQRPVYGPFTGAVINNGRKLVNSPLELRDNRYVINIVDFEKKIVDNNVRMFIFCSPHNPGGRVWTVEELKAVGDICIKHNVLIVADEIHQDLVFKKYKHTPIASLGYEYSNICITCTSPNKTFNIAGLQNANLIIENTDIYNKFSNHIKKLALNEINLFGIIACESAYKTGEDWLVQVLDYIEENKKFVINFFSHKIPDVRIMDNEGTYLLWMDFRSLVFPGNSLSSLILQKANVRLSDGFGFGEEGKGFLRMNIACPRSTLEEALNRIKIAIDSLL